jgi:hypothetical protein
MYTFRQFYADITTNIKAISADSYIPARYIYNEAQSIIADYLKKDNDAKKKLSRLKSGWSELTCIDLEEVPVIECGDIDVRLCDKMMKSVNKIPDIYTYSYGDIIEYVASPNWGLFFKWTTPEVWKAIQTRRYKKQNEYYFFIIENYLYLPIPKNVDLPIEKLRMKAYFKDKKEVDIFNNLKDCLDCAKAPTICTSPLDYEMIIPSYLINSVKLELLNRIAQTYLKIQADNYPNLNNNDLNNVKDLNTYGAP